MDVDRFVDDVKRARMETESQKAVEEVLKRAVSNPRVRPEGSRRTSPRRASTPHLSRGRPDHPQCGLGAPLMMLLPHNHNMWASIGIYTGREDNIIWRARANAVEAAGAASLSEREVFPLPPRTRSTPSTTPSAG